VIPVPPRALRRALLAPAVLALDGAVLAAAPALLLVALVLSPLLGGARPLRMVLIVLTFAARHLGATLACLGLWLLSGAGRDMGTPRLQRAHYAVMRWFVGGIYDVIVRQADVEVRFTESDAARAALDDGRPLLVLGRHAGEGDTLLVLYELVCRHRREPRVVMHEALRLDPLIDVLGDRLPNRFVDPRGGDTEKEIAAMAGELGGTAALVIFPEGANFSEERRRKGIERLRRRGFEREAGWAEGMRHVSAPRPGGTLAAVGAAPHADVVVMGHVGFPNGLREVWRLLPHPQTIHVRLWHEPATAIPAGSDGRIEWLFGWWRRMDDWVEETQRRV
jgi:1-acyl-sn-glycerol-3-phosphate acyltransferase